MWSEFKKFAFKGNVIDMAVGVIIGGAFGKIVTSLVNDLIMPIIGILVGKVNFTDLKIVLSEAEMNAAGEIVKAESAITYGNFLQTVVDFLLIAISIFVFVRIMNKTKKKEEPAPEPPKGPTTEELLAEIRDLLAEKK
ncbi:MAG: large-conductance mechanosensitive channel protein MscL [Clostridia bacterium]|nr:large-conductance mechanosensitive channel protein MscL [Clostridia bacterium]MBQ5813539.1 large-conductance mechanosensitive channel protein MscL [Clostridia bacterium]